MWCCNIPICCPNRLLDAINPSHDGGRGPTVVGIPWTLTIIASPTVAARLYVRKKIKTLYWDDWLMLGALLFQLVDIGLITRAYSFGLGKYDVDLTLEQLVTVLARVSGAVFLIHLFGVRLWFKLYLIVFTTLRCIGGISVLLVSFLTIFTFADLTYVLFPVVIIWRLNMSLSRKVALIFLMCTLLPTAAASIIKARAFQAAVVSLEEPQYASSASALWCGVE
ncbi:hypothetical protein HD806DRAFT_527829 [Xylariaceae sp. AK1471]|nr:hypothetical protein HD806DRAFT_527829 [Xylariaceae sp. AK1471]